jgi:hypothetical protein
MIKAISPTALMLWRQDRDAFLRKYALREQQEPQTQAMAAGSAFDSFVKGYLRSTLDVNCDIEQETHLLFATAVEAHNREWAWGVGRELFGIYQASGALATLVLQLREAAHEPRMELRVDGTIHAGSLGIVPIRGIPDLYYYTGEYTLVIRDWKVNGYMSKASPKPGYINLYGNHRHAGDNHPDAVVMMDPCGLKVNIRGLEEVSPDWALQQCLYAWILGEHVGSPFIAGIEQVSKSGRGDIIITQYSARVGKEFQESVYESLCACWKDITTLTDEDVAAVLPGWLAGPRRFP